MIDWRDPFGLAAQGVTTQLFSSDMQHLRRHGQHNC